MGTTTTVETDWWWDDYYYERTSNIYNFSRTDLHRVQLATAVAENKVRDLKCLLDAGGGINYTDCRRNTLIHYAVRCNRLEVLQVLLETDGAPIDAGERDVEETALLLALRESKEALAILLIKKNADIHLVDNGGHSPLLNSVYNKLLKASKLLIEKGADINCRNYDGATPLFAACKVDWVEGVCMLLYYGADVTIPSRITGKAPFNVASLETQEILFDFIFDGDKIPTLLCTLTDAMVCDSPFLDKLFQNVSQVLYDKEDLFVLRSAIPRMSPHYLKLFIEKFEEAMRDLLLHSDVLLTFSSHLQPRFFTLETISRGIGNLEVLINSQLAPFVVQVINRWRTSRADLFTIGDFVRNFEYVSSNQLQDLMKLTSQLLAQGVQINPYDVNTVYLNYGYCALFKQMIVMDICKEGMWGRKKALMPQLIYDVEMTIEKFLSNTEGYDLESVDLVLEHFCQQQFKEFCLQLNDKVARKVRVLPDVPLLVELARNVSRRYIVHAYKIENFKQLRDTLETLPVPEELRKILTYEKKLYM